MNMQITIDKLSFYEEVIWALWVKSRAECPTEVCVLFQPEQKDFQHSVWAVSDLTFTLMTRKAAASRSV